MGPWDLKTFILIPLQGVEDGCSVCTSPRKASIFDTSATKLTFRDHFQIPAARPGQHSVRQMARQNKCESDWAPVARSSHGPTAIALRRRNQVTVSGAKKSTKFVGGEHEKVIANSHLGGWPACAQRPTPTASDDKRERCRCCGRTDSPRVCDGAAQVPIALRRTSLPRRTASSVCGWLGPWLDVDILIVCCRARSNASPK